MRAPHRERGGKTISPQERGKDQKGNNQFQSLKELSLSPRGPTLKGGGGGRYESDRSAEGNPFSHPGRTYPRKEGENRTSEQDGFSGDLEKTTLILRGSIHPKGERVGLSIRGERFT